LFLLKKHGNKRLNHFIHLNQLNWDVQGWILAG
jgi:hypothetical protein